MPRIRTGTFSASVRKRVEFRVCPRISARGAPLLRAGAGSRAARDVFLSLGKNPDRRPAASLPTTRTCSSTRADQFDFAMEVRRTATGLCLERPLQKIEHLV